MKYLKCKICGNEHAGVAHVFDKPAITKAIDNTKPLRSVNSSKPEIAVGRAASQRTPNRQDRATYNAYQREYKRRMRAP